MNVSFYLSLLELLLSPILTVSSMTFQFDDNSSPYKIFKLNVSDIDSTE